EQTAETYQPNGANPGQAAIRSQQTSSDTQMQQAGASGVPGALSNQPPQATQAPIDAPNGASGATPPTPISDHKDSTTNYELDKTVRHFQQGGGGIKRLSVAVVVNYLPHTDAKGHTTQQALPADKLAQVEQLVKDAMGFDAKRGDSVNVVNSPFTLPVDPNANLPWWRQPDMIALGKQIATYLGIAAVALFLYFVMVKPALRRAFPPPAEQTQSAGALASSADEPMLLDGVPASERAGLEEGGSDAALLAFENEKHRFEKNLEYARQIARQDPKIVATVVKNWVSDER
ncbi:MAG TPA: flagellar M-ring protein FliF C-terminal domain-containing protein, partial [Paraburkholderia sp.]|nr:flagellar M-ring protein FliF C-terminal domain-containing protein [Paraburkholderia sp.]